MENIPLSSDNDSEPEDFESTLKIRSESNGPAPDLIPLGMHIDSQSIPERDVELVDDEAPEDPDQEEKFRLVTQVLELQHTLEDLSFRVDAVKEENLKLRSENQILGQYIENLMAASSVFQSASPKQRRRPGSGVTNGNAVGGGQSKSSGRRS